uniref:HYR domain-containing protein n=1 Tax=Cyclobacterium plantarum TaxID=2716263 RepID=UPI003F6F50B6
NKVWDKTIGGTNNDYLQSTIPTSDGGYLLGGYSFSSASGDKSENSKGGLDYWVVKIDGSGNKVWDKTIGGNNNDLLFSTTSSPDGGYLLAGYSYSPASGDKSENSKGGPDYWAVKIDGAGNKVWDKTIGGTNNDYLQSTIPTSDGGYLLAGYSYSSASGDKSENKKGGPDYWVVKIDGSGNKVWDKTIGGNGTDLLFSTTPSPDGGYLLAGYSYSSASGDKSENSKGGYDYWAVKIDGAGNKVWDKTIGGNSHDYLQSTTPSPDGGYLLAGYSASSASGDKSENSKGGPDYWAVKIDGAGNKVWDKTIGGNNPDYLRSTTPTSDGGYFLGGYSTSSASGDKSENSKGGYDYWVVKLQEVLEDNEAPIIEAIAPITATSDAGTCAASVPFSATVTDNSDPSVSPEFSILVDGVSTPITSPHVFPLGQTEVYVNATDAAGNGAAQQTFTVTVEDNEAPVLATNNITVNLDANGQATIAVADIYDPANSSDNCAIDETSLVLDIISFSCSNIGTPVEVTLSGSDVNNNSSSASATVTVVDNLAPLAVAKNITVELDATSEATITAQDVDNGSSDNCDLSLGVNISSFTCQNVGENLVVLTATDGSGNFSTASATVTVVDNIAPTVVPPANITITNDPASCSAIVDLGQAIVNDNCAGVQLSNNAPADFPVGQTTVIWTAVDASGNQSQAYQDVNVTNAEPVISGSLVAPVDPNPVGSTVTISDVVTDNNIASVEWHWNDGVVTTGTFIYDATTGTNAVSGQRTFSSAQLYTVTLEVTDHCGETVAYTYSNLIVIFDPNGEFVTGGGWINSPAGASALYPNAVGKANFGFVSKYKRGAHIPSGNTEFQFKAGNLNFKSSSYEWLVVAGHSAKFKGEGTVNGGGQYGFMLSAVDGKLKGDGSDRFRIKIWDNDGVIYDNEMGASDEAESTTVIGGGSVVIHKGTPGKNARFDVSETAGRTTEVENPEGPVTLNLQVYPNPLQEKLFIDMESNMDEVVSISIFSMEGRLIHEEKQSIVQGSNTIILEVSRWKATTDQLLLRLMSPSTGFHHFVLLKP